MATMPIVSKTLLSFIFVLVNILISLATAQQSFVNYYCIKEKGNYTTNSTFHANLKTLLSNLSSNTQIDYGFYNLSYGQNSDKVNAIGMCRGDVKPDTCSSCLNDSRVLLPQLCPNQKEAIGWYGECMLRYSNRSIFGIMESYPYYRIWNKADASNVDEFNDILDKFLSTLINRAVAGDSHRKFAAAINTGPSFQTIYAHVQCTPDLSESDCNRCLTGLKSDLGKCCIGKKRGRVFVPSCNLRYDTKHYFDSVVPSLTNSTSPSPSPPPTADSLGKGKRDSWLIVIAVAMPIVSSILLIAIISIYLRRRKTEKNLESEYEIGRDLEIEPPETFQLDFQTIIDATDNFSVANKLGKGGYGPVYKGRLSNGKQVAIKRLSKDSDQGDTEFENELVLVAKLQHRNLVRLLGFCLEMGERILVYEYLPNKSLDYFIFDPIKRLLLDWQSRYKIIEGIARGLLYLHEDSQLRIIHRDLKASNILLDEKKNPKISDFGMAKLFPEDQTLGNASRIVGTYGYMAPEYAKHGQLSTKSDVFSFGVLVLEIVSGCGNSDIHNGEYVEHIISFAWRNWREGNASNIADSTLNSDSRNEVMRCIHIGLLCVQENVDNRPTMDKVALMLNSHSLPLSLPSQPAYCTNASTLSDTGSGESRNNVIEASINEASISELDPR